MNGALLGIWTLLWRLGMFFLERLWEWSTPFGELASRFLHQDAWATLVDVLP